MQKPVKISLAILVWSFFLAGLCYACIVPHELVEIHSKVYSTRHGLPSNYINFISQDDQGCIWVCSQRGIASFDGHGFTKYICAEYQDSAVQYNIVKQDSKGVTWVGLSKGAAFISDGKIVPLPVNWGNEPSAVIAIEEDRQSYIWALCSDENLYRLDDRSLSKPFWPDKSDTIVISRMRAAPDGTIWLAGNTGFYVLNEGIVSSYKMDKQVSIVDFILDSETSGWLVDEDKILYRFDNNQLRKELELADSLYRSIYDMELNSSGGLWIASLKGLYLWQHSQLKSFHYLNGLSSNVILDLFTDREGILWYGSDNGLGKIPSLMFNRLMPSPDLPISSVSGICQDTQGRLWIASNEGLIRVDDEHIKIWHADDGLQSDYIYAVKAFGDSVALTNNSGLFLIDKSDKVKLLANDPSYSFLNLTSHGKTIWLASDYGLFKYTDKTGIVDMTRELSISAQIPVISIFFDSKDRMWIATDGAGLLVVDGEEVENAESITKLPSQRTFSIDEDKEGSIWLGTLGGLVRIENKKVVQIFGLKQGLVSEDVWTVICPETSGIWISTTKGISNITDGKILNYDYSDGLSGEDFVSNCRFLDSENHLWFGGLGITIVDPSFRKLKERPLTHFRFARVNGQKLVDGQKIPAGRNTFEFGLMCSSFCSEKRNLYRYQLLGYDEYRSEPMQTSEFRYTNLPRGHYTLQAESCNRDGLWSESPVKIHFEVLPDWWQRTSIRMIAFLILVLIIRLFVRVRNYQLAKTTARLKEEVQRQTRVIQKQMDRLEKQKNYMESQVKIDDLTKLYNRRHFYNEFRYIWTMRKIESVTLSIVIFDLDHFKNVNDTYGHLKGDEVLRLISSEIMKNTPETGLAARFGGEEIILLLKNADLETAYNIAENIRKSVANLDMGLPDFSVTLSGGVATRKGSETFDKPDSLIKEADDALYRAKASGRNKIVKAE